MGKFSLKEAQVRSEAFNKKLDALIDLDPEAKEACAQKMREIELAITLRQARENAKITQTELAKRMHTTKSAISRFEACGLNRNTPSLSTILKYAHAIGYDLAFKLIPLQK